jgi:ZIP family zinc transporter
VVASIMAYGSGVLFADLPPQWLAFALGFLAGAALCMLVDTLIPEAFESTHAWTGLITLAGFMTAFTLDHVV